MRHRQGIRRWLWEGVEIGLLVLLAFSVMRFFSEAHLPSGQPEAFAPPFSQSISTCPGDINLDQERDVRDVVLLQFHLLNRSSLSGQALANADVSDNGSVDVRDMVQLLAHNLGTRPLASCGPILTPTGVPFIRIVAPLEGPPESSFSLVGSGFGASPADNEVFFVTPEDTVQAQITGAAGDRITGVVPNAPENTYAIVVQVGEESSNAVAFDISTDLDDLAIRPDNPVLLLPPGTGKELLAVGGGTPPYTLKPLSEFHATLAQVELKGSIIEVTGSAPGSILIEVEDSAEEPDTDSINVTLKEPSFEPTFDVLPHNLLAGSSPGFTFLVKQINEDMRLSLTEIQVEGGQSQLSTVEVDQGLGLSEELGRGFSEFKFLQVSEVNQEGVNFDIKREFDGGLDVVAQGTIAPGAMLSLAKFPEPPEEGVTRETFDTEILLDSGLIQLPPAAGQSFDITATFTSNSAVRGRRSFGSRQSPGPSRR